MKTALEILREARALISNPENWTRRTFARDASGVKVYARSPNADQFCAIGAVMHVTGTAIPALTVPGTPGREAWHLLESGFGGSIAPRNDCWTHEKVLRGFDRAIALAEEQSEGAPLPPIEAPIEAPELVTV